MKINWHIRVYNKLESVLAHGMRIAISLLFFLFSVLGCGQSKMPSTSYVTITEASQIIISNPRKALTLLSELKSTFLTESSFDILEDALIYQSVVIVENTIYSLNKHYSKIFVNLRSLEEGSAPFLTQDDSYINIHYMAKFSGYIYKAQQKGDVLYKNTRYASILRGLIDEIEKVSFKNTMPKQQLIQSIKGFLP